MNGFKASIQKKPVKQKFYYNSVKPYVLSSISDFYNNEIVEFLNNNTEEKICQSFYLIAFILRNKDQRIKELEKQVLELQTQITKSNNNIINIHNKSQSNVTCEKNKESEELNFNLTNNTNNNSIIYGYNFTNKKQTQPQNKKEENIIKPSKKNIKKKIFCSNPTRNNKIQVKNAIQSNNTFTNSTYTTVKERKRVFLQNYLDKHNLFDKTLNSNDKKINNRINLVDSYKDNETEINNDLFFEKFYFNPNLYKSRSNPHLLNNSIQIISSKNDVKNFLKEVKSKLDSLSFKYFIEKIKLLTESKYSATQKNEVVNSIEKILGEKNKDLFNLFEKLIGKI